MSSTGTILAAVDAKAQEPVKGALQALGLEGCFIGQFTTDMDRVLIKGKCEGVYPSQAVDPYTAIMATS
jgi:hydrogenase maturation factor